MPTSVDAGRRAPRRDAAENRESLLAAAAGALAEASDASLEAIARSAGLTRRAVYGHFANRDELVIALVDRGTRRLNRIATGVHHPDAPVALALLGARLWDAVEHVRLLAAMAVRDPYVDRVAAALAPVRAELLAIVERGGRDGSLRGDVPPAVLARLIEQSALAVLAEAGRPAAELAAGDARRLVMLAVLGTAGLSWTEAGELIQTTTELAPEPAEATAP
ncbi:TetR family transcriptional regulator [Agromyces sp. CFH 90414]|uniref:TetR family transcriptional regulator n=1 Tax=Agromyces agglutinans TaxID=2662258 RepID=A0A6I2F4F5_9MICO|nr:TetR/AcrR family transcriptional regulator [Agromyces agglutinans]MRG59234.1 TetR family transcriptional regulator [Agromyces agglutinans]